ncbi:MAG: type I glyceraldehyde-3-phosphate dehydrogenase [Gammaproteobacteria bacterium]|nr:type I glyceraldehyde-3-phosphate dehydrogenase [Gammaproteobacteria bacterium]
MTVKIAINGFGRIGRLTARALLDNYKNYDAELVAINDLTDVKTNAHLLQYDSVHGKFNHEVTVENDHIVVDGKKIHTTSERDPSKLPWKELGIDVVFECTGVFNNKTKAQPHLNAGAKKVIISAPAGTDVDATIVYGVNQNTLKSSDTVISNASCTTNCLAPIVKPLNDKIGIENGLMTTIHAATNDQNITDLFHSDLRRARSAMVSMIPTKTGAAEAVGLVLPELAGKLTGFAIRVPTVNVSVVDLTFVAKRDTSVEEINSIMKEAAEGELKGILGYNDLPLVSIDFNDNPHSSTFDASYTKVIGRTCKVMSWYDNEWGFSLRMVDTAMAFMNAK